MGRTLVIAEIGSNHGGNFEQMLQLIRAAKQAGADAVKVQLFRADKLCHPKHPAYETVKANELPREWMPDLVQCGKEQGIQVSATPCDLEAVELLDSLAVPFIKIASGDITYENLIRTAAATGRKLFIATGAATYAEITQAIRWTAYGQGRYLASDPNPKPVIMQCTMAYPCNLGDVNLKALCWRSEWIADRGFSDHTMSTVLPAVAVGMGATVIEKHFTLSRGQQGPDHGHSLEPAEFAQMVANIREAEAALGDGYKKPLPCEQEMRIWARRGNYGGKWLRPTREAGLE